MRNLVITFDTNVWPKSKRKGFFSRRHWLWRSER